MRNKNNPGKADTKSVCVIYLYFPFDIIDGDTLEQPASCRGKHPPRGTRLSPLSHSKVTYKESLII